jgi:hypothetical protein
VGRTKASSPGWKRRHRTRHLKRCLRQFAQDRVHLAPPSPAPIRTLLRCIGGPGERFIAECTTQALGPQDRARAATHAVDAPPLGGLSGSSANNCLVPDRPAIACNRLKQGLTERPLPRVSRWRALLTSPPPDASTWAGSSGPFFAAMRREMAPGVIWLSTTCKPKSGSSAVH